MSNQNELSFLGALASKVHILLTGTTKLKNNKTKELIPIRAKKLDYWRIVAFVGSAIFLFSGFLPMITVAVFPISITLFDMYASLPIDLATVRYLPTIVLYPITLILGFISTVKRKIAIVAGMLGLVCWIDTIVVLSQYHATQFLGTGVYVGIVGSIIIAIAYFLKPSPAPVSEPLTSPPPSPVTPSG